MTDSANPRPPRCRIVGVLDDGAASLGTAALRSLAEADVVIGARRTLALLEAELSPEAQRHEIAGLGAVAETVRAAQAAGRRSVVLATGDPLCHGIAGYLAMQLCLDAIEVLPNLSTIQLACARVGLVSQELKIVSIHAKDAGEWAVGADPRHGLYALAQALRCHERLAVLTSPANTPDRVARLLLAEGLADDFQLAVAERLLQPGERIVAGLSAAEAAAQRFADPNVLLLWRSAAVARPVRFGLPDASYEQRHPDKGLITKHEVRAVSLARLQLREDSVVWDIGAGSGAVGLEAARLCPAGHVYAIEKNADDIAIAARNRTAMGLSNHTLAHGKAPELLDGWADPDAVFIGGSGGELAELVAQCLRRLRPGGQLVMNFVTLENLAAATAALQQLGAAWDVVMLQASRSKPILHMHRLAAENPVWIVCAAKEGAR
ncbi:precorrin-6y C5,15-methyltransferase (decarboxylating) subunit CbiE [Roseateles saccharophilus]|uniref:Precorrin-6Y C5,15-methyltransferase (Decarboxylating) n=1 Tax=Roseateles saccharophilus TaxID=304 RepID=A0A4R3ULG5_ROSSA|nr:precorrin-6y C5,15-methyltransferase (decarboxylating) subunit CbiE [Roseateles saccharophilus]MDG0833513.1 precorrin-6y C5,15-methyltransferase (decarboxylating) subunit CbiE [Roseateles saccharophilus]TCU92536.1 precorrin-6Y C5,15-methyltransferase (decarboxylating) [Roseateles saccharophilus]